MNKQELGTLRYWGKIFEMIIFEEGPVFVVAMPDKFLSRVECKHVEQESLLGYLRLLPLNSFNLRDFFQIKLVGLL